MARKLNRLRLLGDGTKNYLEFLRNLTPQVFLLTFALVIAQKINFTEVDVSNWLSTLIFYVLLLAFIFAFYGNFSQLFSGCYSDIKPWAKKLSAKANATNRNQLSRVLFFLVASVKMRGIVILEMIFVLVLLQVAFAIIIIESIASAVSIIKIT